MNDLNKTGGALAHTKRRGFEEPSDREDFIIPRAKLLQPTSPEVNDNPGVFLPGTIINSLTKDKLFNEKNELVFVPILKNTNWARFNPRQPSDPNFDPAYEKGAMIWRSNDPLDERVKTEAQFGPNGEPPKAIKFLNFLAFIPSQPIMPVVISFSKTSFKAGKELLSLTQFAEGDMFAWEYILTAVQVKGDSGTYYILKIAKGKKNEDNFAKCEQLWNDFHSKELKVDDEATDDAADKSTNTGGEPAAEQKPGQTAPW